MVSQFFPKNDGHFLCLTEILQVNIFEGRILRAKLEQGEAPSRHESKHLRPDVPGAAQEPSPIARFQACYAVQRAQIAFQPVHAPFDLHQEIPLALLEDSAAELVDLSLGDHLSLDDNAHAMTHLLYLVEHVGREEHGKAALAAEPGNQIQDARS